jgi:YHS domain-containing protein
MTNLELDLDNNDTSSLTKISTSVLKRNKLGKSYYFCVNLRKEHWDNLNLEENRYAKLVGGNGRYKLKFAKTKIPGYVTVTPSRNGENLTGATFKQLTRFPPIIWWLNMWMVVSHSTLTKMTS